MKISKEGIAELSLMDEYKETLKREYGIEITQPLFYFNRLKVKVEGCGEGTLLMQEVVKILDERSLAVINYIHPYGSMDLATLTTFYAKYGFKKILDGLMFRIPCDKSAVESINA